MLTTTVSPMEIDHHILNQYIPGESQEFIEETQEENTVVENPFALNRVGDGDAMDVPTEWEANQNAMVQ